MCSRRFVRRLIGAVLACCLYIPIVSLDASEPDEIVIKAELEKRIELWEKYMQDNPRLSDYTGNQYFSNIVNLGIPAIPYMMERIQKGSWMLGDGVIEIIKKRFEEYEQNEYPVRDSVSTASALVKWWPNAGKDTEEKFKKLYAERKALLKEGKKKEADEKLGYIRSLGIGGLPYLMEKIGAGDSELVGVVSWLTDGKVEKEAKAKDVVSWWEKNEKDWVIAFPDANTKPVIADIPKRGTDMPYIVGGAVGLVIAVGIVMLSKRIVLLGKK